MRLVIILIFIAFSCNSCKQKKVVSSHLIVEKENSKYTLPNLKGSKKLTIYCWCYSQNSNQGGCVTEMAMTDQEVIQKNQIIYSTTNQERISSFINVFLENYKIVGAGQNTGVEARLVLKFINSDSSYHTISFNEHSNYFIGIDDSAILEIQKKPILLLNKLTDIKNIECDAN